MRTSVVLVALCCYVALVVCAPPLPPSPAIKGTLQQSVISEFTEKLVPMLEKLLPTIPLPDVSGEEKITLVGRIAYTLSNIDLKSISFPDATVTFTDDGAALKVSGGTGHLECDWKWRKASGIFHPSDKGKATITISKAEIYLSLKIAEYNNAPTVTVDKIDVNLKKFKINISSPWTGWVYDMFLWIFNGPLKSSVSNAMEAAVVQVVHNVNNQLQALSMFVPVGDMLFDLRMPSSPTYVAAGNMTTPYAGAFRHVDQQQEPPFVPVALPDRCNSQMMNLLLAEYVFDSLTYSMYEYGDLYAVASKSSVPDDFQWLFNTSYWTAIIPKLNQTYPNQEMTISVNATKMPQLNMSTAGFTAIAPVESNFWIMNPNGTKTLAIVLAVDFKTQFTLFVSQTNSTNNTDIQNVLHASMEVLEMKVSVVKSYIGNVNLLLLNTGLKTLFRTVVIPLFNQRFADAGFPLPGIDGLQLVQPNVLYFNGYVCLESSVNVGASQDVFGIVSAFNNAVDETIAGFDNN